ncbi:MAG TPA: hypothetical protein PLP64_06185 [Pseudothermotoga sp.]|nr:hypothetical protein [Pseudothermotoga sp.]HOK83799.1 hypothetical protein [Pseudothermotoga sp.]HPP70297.1 hypothetical protein [Pseudothermotoga sp.]
MKFDNGYVSLSVKGKEKTYKLSDLNEDFYNWQLQTRSKGLKIFLGLEKGAPNFSPHTVVMSTYSEDTEFPVNSCIKGLGLVPKDEYIEDLAKKAMDLIQLAREKGINETFRERVQFLLNLYDNPDLFNKSVLSSIEMYYKKSYQNVLKDPRATLLFYDQMTGYSIMFNVVVELIPRTDPFYKYVTAVHDLFHVPKDPSVRTDRYEFAYRFWPIEAYDKTPGPKASSRIF